MQAYTKKYTLSSVELLKVFFFFNKGWLPEKVPHLLGGRCCGMGLLPKFCIFLTVLYKVFISWERKVKRSSSKCTKISF